jgi:hypothetical protein
MQKMSEHSSTNRAASPPRGNDGAAQDRAASLGAALRAGPYILFRNIVILLFEPEAQSAHY